MSGETYHGMALCAGYGGLDLGLDLALGGRLRTVCYIEREARAAETLVARMEESTLERAPIWDDLRTFDGRPWRGRVDILTAGYPCQPFSQAGKKLGAADPRHLWPEVRRILRETGAPVAFFENVRGHVRNGLADVLADLDADGFDAEWGVLGAADVGAPHKRERLWILAWRRPGREVVDSDGPGSEGSRSSFEAGEPESAHAGGPMADPQGDVRGARSDSLGEARAGAHPERGDLPATCGDLVADPDGGGCQGSGLPTGGTNQRESGGQPDGCGADWGRPWPPAPGDLDGWAQAETQPAVRGVANGTPEGVDNGERLRMLGNGVVPLAAAVAFRTLANRAGLNL